jgi:hypothetical protein
MRHFTVNHTPYVLFEPDPEEIVRVAAEAGFQADIERRPRVLLIRLTAPGHRPMFFDAADPRQGARLASGRTFVSGSTGTVYNTPFVLDWNSGPGVVVRMCTEVRWDIARKYPHGPCETSLLLLFQQLAQDLAGGMVGMCGTALRLHPARAAR